MSKVRATLKLSDTFAAIALFVLATALAALLLARPRAVAPLEMPDLVLPRDEVMRAIADDQRAARAAPHTADAEALRALLTKQYEADLGGDELVTVFQRRRAELRQRYQRLVAAQGEDAALRLRAAAATEFSAALDLALPARRAQLLVAGMRPMLQREGVARDGQLVAPRFVARTLFLTRWNLLHGLSPTHRFKRIERRVYYGWEALHVERLPAAQRAAALERYAQAGGAHAEEALGVLYYRQHDYPSAAQALEAAFERDSGLRLRNYVLGARARIDDGE